VERLRGTAVLEVGVERRVDHDLCVSGSATRAINQCGKSVNAIPPPLPEQQRAYRLVEKAPRNDTVCVCARVAVQLDHRRTLAGRHPRLLLFVYFQRVRRF